MINRPISHIYVSFIAGVGLKLTEEEIKAIDEPYRPRAVAGFF